MIIRKHKRYEKNAIRIPKEVRKKEEMVIAVMEASSDLQKMMQVDMLSKHPEPVINKPHLFSIRVNQAYRIFFTISEEDYKNELDHKERIVDIYLILINKHDYERVSVPAFNKEHYQ